MKARTRRKRRILRERRHHRRHGWCWTCTRRARLGAAWALTMTVLDRYGSVQGFLDALREDEEQLAPGVTLVRKKAGPAGIGTPPGPAF